jgi:hypothetical protein
VQEQDTAAGAAGLFLLLQLLCNLLISDIFVVFRLKAFRPRSASTRFPYPKPRFRRKPPKSSAKFR